MTELPRELADELFSHSASKPEELSQAILTSAAIKLYQSRKLSTGKAAQLAGLSRVQFFEELGHAGVNLYDPSPQEFSAELELL